MQPLSSDPRSIRDRYGVAVVGSGYGGSITAARLAQAGLSVCLLERGKEWIPGTFPDELSEVVAAVRTESNALGIFDYVVGDDQDVLVGSGLGGTSLINANVVIRPDEDVFRQGRWPMGLREAHARGDLDRYRERVLGVLEPTAAGPRGGWPKKVAAMQRSAARMGREARPLEVAVNLRKYDNRENASGVVQRLCTLCGDCVTGCNVGAKNTLYMNYLPLARRAGAEIYTRMEVDYVRAAPGGGYFVHVRHHAEDGPRELALHAGGVVLAAGALGSTGILLRSQARGLPLSRRVGHHFSGNADTLGFGYNNDVRTDVLGFGAQDDDRAAFPVGPTILSSIDFRDREELAGRFLIEEGAIPRALVDTLRHGLPLISAKQGVDTDKGFQDKARELGRIIRDQVGFQPEGAANHSMVYLGMGHDGADGRIVLDPEGRPRLLWHGLAERRVFREIDGRMHEVVAALGGTYVRNPRWSKLLGRNQITVHPLGGCPMGDDPDAGVVNEFGQVFDPEGRAGEELHPGLYVVDGAILPTSVGVNPLLTISMLAERSAEHIVAKARGVLVPPAERVPVPPPVALPVGLEFTEEMKGHFMPGARDAVTPEQYAAAAEDGKQENRFLNVRLWIVVDDIQAFVENPEHEARAEGTVDGVAGRMRRVDEGTFNLFVEDPQQGTKRMHYRLAFEGEDGRPYVLYGFKEIRDDKGFDAWSDSTTLFVTVREGLAEDGPILGQGVLRIHILDLMRQVASIRARNSPSTAAGLRWVGRFGRFFFGSLWDTYVRNRITSPD